MNLEYTWWHLAVIVLAITLLAVAIYFEYLEYRCAQECVAYGYGTGELMNGFECWCAETRVIVPIEQVRKWGER